MVTPKSSNEGCRFTESPTKPFRTSPTSSDPKKKMYKRVRPLYTILLLLIAAASLTTLHLFNLKTRAHKPPFNQTLLRQAEVDINEPSLNQEIEELLGENYRSTVAQMSVRYTFRYLGPHELHHLWSKFKQSLSEWSEKRAALNRSGVFSEFELRVRYNSCAVVGNSGILLGSRHGQLVDSHEAVIRLNNARTEGHERDVGSRTSVSFVNSNVLHACARRGVGCAFCHVYGEWVPMVTYACQLAHLVDCLVCNSSRPGSVILTDPRFDVLCARIVKYYSLRRFGGGGGWAAARGGKDFHYSSGMQAVMMAAGVCRRVSLFGFGKSGRARHHYHTRQVAELSLHDYEAEYDFYRDLVAGRGGAVPFVAEGFEFPPVVRPSPIVDFKLPPKSSNCHQI